MKIDWDAFEARLDEIAREKYKTDFSKLNTPVKRAYCMEHVLSEIQHAFYAREERRKR